ncbi:MAG: sporulation protein YtfJ [Clostridiaceae bacterium]|nr:sporulation protein YtfJ [Clostridiaceae bacterium]
MREHPIEGLMLTAMNSIRDMIDVNTIIGEPIETSNDIIIIPISKVGFGFAAGGSEFRGETIEEYSKKDKEEAIQYKLPFGGGSGAGVSISPVAFIIVQGENVKLLPVNHTSAVDKLLDYIPDLLEKANNIFNKEKEKNNEENKNIKTKKDSEEENINVVIPNTNKFHPKRNKPIKYEVKYDEPEDFTFKENEDYNNENLGE